MMAFLGFCLGVVHTEPEIAVIVSTTGGDVGIGLAHPRIEEDLRVGDRCNTSVSAQVAAGNGIGGPANFRVIERLPSLGRIHRWLVNHILGSPRGSG